MGIRPARNDGLTIFNRTLQLASMHLPLSVLRAHPN
jgi:hypothetical protein